MRKLVLANTYEMRRRDVVEQSRRELSKSQICLVNFSAGPVYEYGQGLQIASAAQLHEFDIVQRWSPKRIRQTPFYHQNKDILDRERGAGFWLWKPYIIDHAMSLMDDGDFIIYCDTGRHATQSFDFSVLPLCKWLMHSAERVAAFRLEGFKNSIWTKRDCFYFMGCDDPAFWDCDQVQASYVAMQVNSVSRKFVQEWLEAGADSRIITDDPNTCGLDNHHGFLEHRHDQSILTNLVVKHQVHLPSVGSSNNCKNKNINFLLNKIIHDNAIVPAGRLLSGASATQSSTSFWSHAADEANNALDPHRSEAYAFHTQHEKDPWWMAHFPIVEISEIHILNRTDVLLERSKSLIVEVEIGNAWVEIFDASRAEWCGNIPIILEIPQLLICRIRVSLRGFTCLHLHSVGIYETDSHRDAL